MLEIYLGLVKGEFLIIIIIVDVVVFVVLFCPCLVPSF